MIKNAIFLCMMTVHIHTTDWITQGHLALFKNNVDAIKEAIDHKYLPTNNELRLAVAANSLEIVKFLLDHPDLRFDINEKNESGRSALLIAHKRNSPIMAEILLNHGANIADLNSSEGRVWLNDYFWKLDPEEWDLFFANVRDVANPGAMITAQTLKDFIFRDWFIKYLKHKNDISFDPDEDFLVSVIGASDCPESLQLYFNPRFVFEVRSKNKQTQKKVAAQHETLLKHIKAYKKAAKRIQRVGRGNLERKKLNKTPKDYSVA